MDLYEVKNKHDKYAKYVIRNIDVECLKNIGNFINVNLSTIFFIPIDELSVRK